MTYLLDANVLIALSVREHDSKPRAKAWLDVTRQQYAACPITQGALVRFYARFSGVSGVKAAKESLAQLNARPDFVFWADDVSYLDLPMTGLRGHKQVTDYYLVALARAHGGKLATMDEALAALFPDVCELIPH